MNEDRPRIEFPCRYPIKVMGAAGADLASTVLEIGRRHADGVTEDDVTVRTSRKGNWVSVTLVIEARSEAQIAAIFEDLKATGLVELVL
jgi:putative lipoic acid-binding regulatory protein